MSILAIEGFELYPVITNASSADMAARWIAMGAAAGTSNYCDIVSGITARTGSRHFRGNISTQRLQRFLQSGEENATVIVGFGLFNVDTNSIHDIVALMSDTHTTVHVTIQVTTTGAIRAFRGNSAGTTLGTSAAGVVPTGAWCYFEAKVLLSGTVGTVACYIDGTNVLNLTAQNTKNGGTKTTFDDIEVGCISMAGGSGGVYLDDVYELTGDATPPNDILGPCKVRTLWPSGNGASSAGVGSDADSVNNYLLVQDTTPSTGTATYVDLQNTNDTDTYAFDDLPDTSGTVAAVQSTTYADKTDAGARTLAHVTRIAGTNYPSANQTPTTSFAWQVIRQTVSPATAVAFTRAEVNGAEFGVKAT